ncbi:MAG TPA: hypothetical protein VJ596_02530 [Gemmatimonadaceae bacterium]|nr:hypothetical protein [Gemmatimonadaceae bacterium]
MERSESNGHQPGRLLRALLLWTALTTVMFWLPAVRGLFDGRSYTWGIGGFGGSGLDGDYWFPLAGVAFALVLQLLGWRGARRPFHILLVGWHLLLVAGAAYAGQRDPEAFRFRGDSLGIDVSLVWIGPLLFGIPAILALVWAWRDVLRTARPSVPPWGPRNTRWLLGLLALLPVQFALLRSGAPGSTADVVGVLITIAQWLLVGKALRPYSPHALAVT